MVFAHSIVLGTQGLMLLLLLSSFLFGLNHPLAAVLVKNEDSLLFSFQFLVVLVLIQLPLVIIKHKEVIHSCKNQFILLLISGFIGTFLYWCEFSSIQVGLPISHITFLTLTVPAWVLFYEMFRGKGTKSHLNKWMIALIGSAFLIAPGAKGEFSIAYLLPVFTSLLTAAWLINSKKATHSNIHPVVYSFFNDLFSLIGVFCFIVFNNRTSSIAMPTELGSLSFYALIVGVLPNLFLFYGLKNQCIMKATTIVMLEPILSILLTFFIHHEVLGINFLIGSSFITLSNMPSQVWIAIRARIPAIVKAS